MKISAGNINFTQTRRDIFKALRTFFHKFHMRDGGLGYNLYIIDKHTTDIFTSSTLFSVLFQSVFHYWALYKQFEYRAATSRFKTSLTRDETGIANPIFRTQLSARDRVISIYFNAVTRLAGVFYVTPDHLHRYRKPTARNIASWDLRVRIDEFRRRRLFALYPAYVLARNRSCVRIIGLRNRRLQAFRKCQLRADRSFFHR